ncbi:MAG TPA: hypothetical protein VMJ70_03420, partial [Candidatus Sulfotelmatobacter sp.]|nr:hypothetical protein [Candidatus Sulfotelmatobacter sp.]
ENHDGGTPAMRLGLRDRPLSVGEILKWRLFPQRVGLPQPWQEYYRRVVPTSPILNPRQHSLKLAV